MIYMHLNFCCVTVDAINETMADYLNETDLFGGESYRPLVIAPLFLNQPLEINPFLSSTNHKSLTNSNLRSSFPHFSKTKQTKKKTLGSPVFLLPGINISVFPV